ncbi:MAG: cellulase family glycosylhydrolase [Planctomycetota bacterium]
MPAVAFTVVLLLHLVIAGGETAEREVVTVTVSGPRQAFPHLWEEVVGAGHASLHLRRDFQEHLARGARELGFRAVRCHGIFGDELQVLRRDAEGALHTNWQNVFAIYDAYLELGVRPFVELSFMPSALASGEATVFQYRGNVTPPRSLDEWKWFIADFASKLVERYGRDEVRQWRFEVWNEPDIKIFWAGTERDYFALYEATAEALRSVDPLLQVGGPGGASPRFVTRLLAYAASARATPLPVDFVSFHTYGGNIRGPQATYAPIHVLTELARQVREVRDRSPYGKAKLHVTEWNSTPESRDGAHDTPLNAAFVCEAVAIMHGAVDSFAYWTVSDVFEERGFPDRPFHGGFGLITIHGLCKPSFHAFALLHLLGEERLPLESTASAEERPCPGLATIDASGTVRILLWTWPYAHPRSPTGARALRVEVKGLGPGSYEGRRFLVDETHGNVLRAWRAMGEPAYPTREQLLELRRADDLHEETSEIVDAGGGSLCLELDLDVPAVSLVELRRLTGGSEHR